MICGASHGSSRAECAQARPYQSTQRGPDCEKVCTRPPVVYQVNTPQGWLGGGVCRATRGRQATRVWRQRCTCITGKITHTTGWRSRRLPGTAESCLRRLRGRRARSSGRRRLAGQDPSDGSSGSRRVAASPPAPAAGSPGPPASDRWGRRRLPAPGPPQVFRRSRQRRSPPRTPAPTGQEGRRSQVRDAGAS